MTSCGAVLTYRQRDMPGRLTVGFATPRQDNTPAFTIAEWAEVCSRMGGKICGRHLEEVQVSGPESPGDIMAAEKFLNEYYYVTFESTTPEQLDKDALLAHLVNAALPPGRGFVPLATHRYSNPYTRYDWDIEGGPVLPLTGVGEVAVSLINDTHAPTVPLPRIGDIVAIRGETICLPRLVYHSIDVELALGEAVPVRITFLDLDARQRLLTEPQDKSPMRIVIGRP
jgi:hypothetical protein